MWVISRIRCQRSARMTVASAYSSGAAAIHAIAPDVCGNVGASWWDAHHTTAARAITEKTTWSRAKRLFIGYGKLARRKSSGLLGTCACSGEADGSRRGENGREPGPRQAGKVAGRNAAFTCFAACRSGAGAGRLV